MKTIRYALALALALAFSSAAQTNLPPMDNFALVTNLWYNGYKSNVLAIAEQRLAANSNDLAGLILKMEYNLEFSNDNFLSNDILRVLSVASNTTSKTIHSRFTEIYDDLTSFLIFLKNDYHLTPSEMEEERANALIIHKRMTYEDYLKWLHDDGLF